MKTLPYRAGFILTLLCYIFLTPFPLFSGEYPDQGPQKAIRLFGVPQVDISISFDMEERLMHGSIKILFHKAEEGSIHSGGLKIKSMRLNGNPIMPVLKDGVFKVKTERDTILEIDYECASLKHGSCVIDKRGIFLRDNWYPSIEGLALYRLKAIIPPQFIAISEAEDIKMERHPQGNLFSFNFPYPLDGIHLMAGRFVIKKEDFKGIELNAYFFPEDIGLAETYLEYTKRYLELYEGLIAPYPYKRFSIVENFLPTGYSMPTFTLLGQDVIRLPFIVKTSLGHEILHQWFGNFLYIDYAKGNWAEGLTTYLAEHLYEEQEGRGWQYRKKMLIDYHCYVSPQEDFPLRDFRGRVDFASRAIGYGKSAMLFHMLRRLVGDDVFYSSLKRLLKERSFQRVSWDDIRAIFENTSNKKLDWFFQQWLNEKGFPQIEVKNIRIRPEGLRFALSFDVIQKGRPYIMDIPVSIKTEGGERREVLKISSERQGFEVLMDEKPKRLVLDEDYDTFRGLSVEETPPVIAKIIGEKGLLVLPQDGVEIYSDMIEHLRGKGYEIRKEVRDEDIKRFSMLLLGYENPVIKRLFGKIDKPSSDFLLMVKKNPLNPSKVIAIVHSSSKDETRAALKKLFHYGRYSMVAFKEGKNIEKKIEDTDRGWGMPLRETVIGVELENTIKLYEVIERVSHKKIVYVGEQHDKYEHHLSQLEIIKGLFKKNPLIAIGMEMFQRPFQMALDDYIEGRIGEREFLRSSEYFKGWGYDYNLYKEILRFARDERIPVVALNIRKEIVSKVSREGLNSLTDDERKELPDSMDMTDEDYKERLREAFKMHKDTEIKDFESFHQSQIIRDEIMAQSIDEFMRKNPHYQMVVLAGNGHLSFGSGIPKRAFRRNGLDYAIILNDAPIESGIAHFVLFPRPLEMTSSPKLMVMLREENGRVRITGFSKRSISEEAGLREGDIILSLDGSEVRGIDDIRIALFYKKQGEDIKVRVLRKRFLFGEEELEFDVPL